jgi:transposase
MKRGEILEYPYYGTIKRVIEGETADYEVIIYEGVMDEHMVTDEEGRTLQTASYIISIPLTKNENDEWIVPLKGDKITLTRYGETFDLVVDNADPSQIGGVSIYAARNTW